MTVHGAVHLLYQYLHFATTKTKQQQKNTITASLLYIKNKSWEHTAYLTPYTLELLLRKNLKGSTHTHNYPPTHMHPPTHTYMHTYTHTAQMSVSVLALDGQTFHDGSIHPNLRQSPLQTYPFEVFITILTHNKQTITTPHNFTSGLKHIPLKYSYHTNKTNKQITITTNLITLIFNHFDFGLIFYNCLQMF